MRNPITASLVILALALVGQVAEAKPSKLERVKALISLAHQQMDIGEDEKALVHVRELLRVEPENPYAYYLSAKILSGLKRFPEAFKTVADGMRILPENNLLYFGRAEIYFAKGELKSALEDADHSLKIMEDFECRRLRARVAKRLGLYQRSADDYSVLIANFKKWFDNKVRYEELRSDYEARGRCYMQLKQYQKAVSDFTYLITTDVSTPIGYKLRAEAYTAMGKKDLAAADMTKSRMANDEWAPPSSFGHK